MKGVKRVRGKSSKINEEINKVHGPMRSRMAILTAAESPDTSICLGSVAEKPASRGSSVHSVESVESGDDSTLYLSNWCIFYPSTQRLSRCDLDVPLHGRGGHRPVERESRSCAHFSGGIKEVQVGVSAHGQPDAVHTPIGSFLSYEDRYSVLGVQRYTVRVHSSVQS